MKFGICELAVVPVRSHPGDSHEMCNQLLFGDVVIIKAQEGNWLLIETSDDEYEGWIDIKQIAFLSEEEYNKLNSANRIFSPEYQEVKTNNPDKPVLRIPTGSSLPLYKNRSFQLAGESFPFEGKVIFVDSKPDPDKIIELAQLYLECPYLWGGRSPFGIDCSGFVQIVFKMNGILLPRDSSQQVLKGENVHLLHEAKTADLAFFENDEGSITHVGILLNDSKIIHSSGKVRIDTIDHQGIYNKELNSYTHKLRIVKRILTS